MTCCTVEVFVLERRHKKLSGGRISGKVKGENPEEDGRLRYESDLTAKEWERIKYHFEPRERHIHLVRRQVPV